MRKKKWKKIYQVVQKLNNCKKLLVKWSKKVVSNNMKVTRLIKQVEILQRNQVTKMTMVDGLMRKIMCLKGLKSTLRNCL